MRQKNNIRHAWRGAGNFSYVWKNIRRHTSGIFSWNTPVIYWIPVHSSCTFHFLQVTVIANEIIPAILLVGNENYVVGVVDLRTYIYFKVAIRLFTSDTSKFWSREKQSWTAGAFNRRSIEAQEVTSAWKGIHDLRDPARRTNNFIWIYSCCRNCGCRCWNCLLN